MLRGQLAPKALIWNSLRVPQRVTCEERKGKQYLIPDKLPLAFLHSKGMCESQRLWRSQSDRETNRQKGALAAASGFSLS